MPSAASENSSSDTARKGPGEDAPHTVGEPARAGRGLAGSGKWLPWVIAVAGIVVALYLGKGFVDRAGKNNPPTQLEQLFFGVYTLFVGAFFSWLCTHYYAKSDALERFRQLARPALRRVVAARESAGGLLNAVDRRAGLVGDGHGGEGLASLRELIEQHARVLDDAMEDWRELLPSDVERADQTAMEISALRTALANVDARVSGMVASAPKTDPNVEAIQGEVARLRQQVEASPRLYGFGGSGHLITSSPITGLPTVATRVGAGINPPPPEADRPSGRIVMPEDDGQS